MGAAACPHWLEIEISLVKPEAVIALGATGAASLLGRHAAPMPERAARASPRADGLRVFRSKRLFVDAQRDKDANGATSPGGDWMQGADCQAQQRCRRVGPALATA